jgi:hypothetical protein
MTMYASYRQPDGQPTLYFERRLAHPRLLAFYWADDLLRFELEPADSGTACLLRFTVALDSEAKAARDGAGWHVCLDALERSLTAEPENQHGDHGWEHRYEEYKRRGFPATAAIPGRD